MDPVVYDASVGIFLNCWRTVLGIKEKLTGEELDINSGYILRLYPDLTIKELYLAIDKSMLGVLAGPDKKPLETKAYANFSPSYISSVLNAYIRYRDNEMSRILTAKHREELSASNTTAPLSPEQKVTSRRLYLQHFIDSINREDIIPFYDKNDVAWNFLTRNKLIDPAHAERIDLKQKALVMERLGKTPWEASMIGEANVNYVKHLVMKEFFAANEIKLGDFTDEQIML